MPKISLVYSTFPRRLGARKIAKQLVNKKLAACAIFFPAESVYLWNKKTKSAKESIAFFKTSAAKSKKLISELEKVHPYKIPCILEFSPNTNKAYFEWVLGVLEANDFSQ